MLNYYDKASVDETGGRKEPVSCFITLAPLAGVSDHSFRELCFRYGCDGATTEMISAQALLYDSARTQSLLTKGEEGALVVQLFGKDPAILSRVIREHMNNDSRFCAVELNMGCPAPKIVKNGEGSALMREPEKVAAIFHAMRKASEKPVYVKMRLGWDAESINFLEIAHIAEEEGLSQVTLHARTREQMYAGKADWEAIARLKDHVSLPVVGNGDVFKPEDAVALWEQTHCDGITIGRGAMGNPFLFRQIHEFCTSGTYAPTAAEEMIDVLLEHYAKEIAWRGEKRGILEMRKQMACYLGGYFGATQTKSAIMQMTTMAEIREALAFFLKRVQEAR